MREQLAVQTREAPTGKNRSRLRQPEPQGSSSSAWSIRLNSAGGSRSAWNGRFQPNTPARSSAMRFSGRSLTRAWVSGVGVMK